jgi:hypothetical protein
MAMKRTTAWLAVASIFCLPGLASALYIELKTPGVAFAQQYPADAQAKVMSALTRPELKFLGGFGLNSQTTLRYRCDIPGVNRLLADLANCPAVSIQVRFVRIDDECDVRVNHLAQNNNFQVEVNLKTGRIRVEDVELPSIKGPELKR